MSQDTLSEIIARLNHDDKAGVHSGMNWPVEVDGVRAVARPLSGYSCSQKPRFLINFSTNNFDGTELILTHPSGESLVSTVQNGLAIFDLPDHGYYEVKCSSADVSAAA